MTTILGPQEEAVLAFLRTLPNLTKSEYDNAVQLMMRTPGLEAKIDTAYALVGIAEANSPDLHAAANKAAAAARAMMSRLSWAGKSDEDAAEFAARAIVVMDDGNLGQVAIHLARFRNTAVELPIRWE
ncbi:hypothetical protein IC744_15805 [Microbacterium hominis]|uniref:hypothetical protein n=1 Tax=Microbacterium hominis TaxID=162426 RepID=UPI00168B429E|nr:hypothetical protein [Microbacterium hominis]QOC24728.1 hypothetical protein IC745_10045 [Microbacterium hominis]QOC28784.1 hypothetical protein IC744_15805 [Microbacterium hominis]